LRIPVGALDEQALMSAIASGSVSTSGGRRRGLDVVEELVDGGRSPTAMGAYGHESVHFRDHFAPAGRSNGG
jgi:hypothetical protein